jgi:hypothetical protein
MLKLRPLGRLFELTPRQGYSRLLCGVCLAVFAQLASPALAQEAPAAAAPADAGVVPYPAAFFEEFRPQSALDMIGRLPGFSFDGGSDGRGFAGNAGNVLIDGERPPSRGDSLGSVLSRIPASSVLRIDLVRGGAGGIDMQGKPVVANVIRKPNTGLKATLSGTMRTDESGLAAPNAQLQLQRSANGRSFDGSISANAGGNPVDNRRTRFGPGDVVLLRAIADGQQRYHIYNATGAYEGGFLGGRIRANGLFQTQRNHFHLRDRLVFPGGAEITTNAYSQDGGEAGLRYTRKLPHDIGLEIVGFQRLRNEGSDNSYDTPSFTSGTRSKTQSGESILSGKLQPKGLGAWTFEGGVEAALNFVDNRTRYSFNNAPLSLSGDATRVEELRTETFGTATWAPTKTLSIETGVRYERSTITASGSAGGSDKTLGFVKPRLNIAWSPAKGHQFGLRIERTVDQLSFGAFAASASFSTGIFGVGNPDIEPAKTWKVDGRYEYRFGKQGSVVVEYVHDQITDRLSAVVVQLPDPNGGPPRTFDITRNIGPARRDTLSITTSLPLDSIGVSGGLLSLYGAARASHMVDPITGIGRGFSNENPWDWSLNFSQNLVARRISWGFGASGEADTRFFDPRDSGGRHEDWGAGGSITYRPTDRASFSFGANNVTRVGSRSTFVLYDAPRNVGTIVYTEKSFSRSTMSVYVSARRNF